MYIPCIYVLNKIDQISIEELDIIYKIPHCVPISAQHKWNFDDLLDKVWAYLNLMRMYELVFAPQLINFDTRNGAISATQSRRDSFRTTQRPLFSRRTTAASKISA